MVTMVEQNNASWILFEGRYGRKRTAEAIFAALVQKLCASLEAHGSMDEEGQLVVPALVYATCVMLQEQCIAAATP